MPSHTPLERRKRKKERKVTGSGHTQAVRMPKKKKRL